MKQAMYFYLLVFCTLSCNDNEMDAIYVESEMQVYFEKFIDEAMIYEMDVQETVGALSGYFESIEDDSAVGQCRRYSDGSSEIIVDPEYWSESDSLRKEFIVFHELGHCVLGRDHNDTRTRDGSCYSIMNSGTNRCRYNYTEDTRSEYLKELFGQ